MSVPAIRSSTVQRASSNSPRETREMRTTPVATPARASSALPTAVSTSAGLGNVNMPLGGTGTRNTAPGGHSSVLLDLTSKYPTYR